MLLSKHCCIYMPISIDDALHVLSPELSSLVYNMALASFATLIHTDIVSVYMTVKGTRYRQKLLGCQRVWHAVNYL